MSNLDWLKNLLNLLPSSLFFLPLLLSFWRSSAASRVRRAGYLQQPCPDLAATGKPPKSACKVWPELEFSHRTVIFTVFPHRNPATSSRATATDRLVATPVTCLITGAALPLPVLAGERPESRRQSSIIFSGRHLLRLRLPRSGFPSRCCWYQSTPGGEPRRLVTDHNTPLASGIVDYFLAD